MYICKKYKFNGFEIPLETNLNKIIQLNRVCLILVEKTDEDLRIILKTYRVTDK